MFKELKIHEYDKNLFCKKLQARMVDLKLCEEGNANETKALVNLHNKLYPNQQLQYNPKEATEKINRDNTIKAYRKWVKGQSIPEFTTLLELCNALKVHIDYFFTDTEAPTPEIEIISDNLKLSPKAIEKLMCYDSGFLRILDNLICTEHKEYPDYTGTLELLLKTLWDYSYRMKTENIELKTTNAKPQIITDQLTKRELFKPIPLKIFDSCLDIAEQR